MKKQKLLLLALGIACTTVGMQESMAQKGPENGTWSLQEAINYAIQNNLRVKQAKVSKDIADVNLKQSRFGLLPNINGSGTHTYNYGSSVDPLTSEFRTQQIRSNNFSVSSTVPLFQGFQQQNQVKQNRLLAQASSNDVDAMQNDVILQVITSYLNVLFANELLKTAELQRASTEQQLKRTQILYKAGSVAQTNVLELEAQFASDELNVINAQNQIDIAKLNLIQLLDLDNPEKFEIQIPQIPEPTLDPVAISPNQVYDVAVQTLPDIQSADLRVRSAEVGVAIARGAYYPRFNFGAGIFTGYSSARLSPVATQIEGAFQRQTLGFQNPDGTNPLVVYFPESTRGEYTFSDQLDDNLGKQLQFSLQVPIFNGLATRSAVQRAKLNQQNAQLNAELERNTLRQTIEQAAADAMAAHKKYVASKRQVASLEQGYRNAELRLNSGVINTVDFNVIANNYRRAQSDLIQAKYDYFFKLKVLDFYQGKDISF